MTKLDLLPPAWMENAVVGAGLLTIMWPTLELQNSTVLVMGSVFLLSCFVQEVERIKEVEFLAGLKLRPHSSSGLMLGNILIPMVTASSTASPSTSTSLQLDNSYQSLVQYLCVVTPLTLLVSAILRWKPATEYHCHHQLWIFPLFGILAWAFQLRHDVAFFIVVALAVFLTVYFFLTRLLYFLPESFSLGEAVLVSESLTLLTVMAASALTGSTTKLFACLQVLVLGCIAIGIAVSPVAKLLLSHHNHHPPHEENPSEVLSDIQNRIRTTDSTNMKLSVYFYLCITSTIILVLLPWLGFFLGQQPLVWGLLFVTSTKIRMALLCLWVVLVMGAVGVVKFHQSSSTIVRKNFHLLAICIYVPGILYDVQLLYLASAGTIFIFVVLEFLRVLRVWPLGDILHNAFTVFLDDQDSGTVILTHLYLLLGMSIPVVLYTETKGDSHSGSSLAVYSGILSLGVGDTAASVVGSLYGKIRWPGSKKTVEGTCAAIVTQLVGCYIILHCLDPQVSPLYGWTSVVWAVTLTSILEAVTTQIDNLVLPIFMYSLLIRL